MHICFLCNEYPPGSHGGVGSKVQVLGRGLVAQGHRVSVVGIYPVARLAVENDQGVHVVRVPHARVRFTGFAINGFRLRHALLAVSREGPIDIVEGTELGLACLSRAFPRTKTIRMCGGHHFFAVTLGRKPRLWRSWLERRSFARATALCGVSHFVADTTRELLGIGDRPIEVLPNPVDISLFRPMPEIREEDGLILFVGAVCEKKGVRQLILAMPDIVRAVPHARLLVVGRDTEDPRVGGSFTQSLRRLLPDGLRDRVQFFGVHDHASLPKTMAKASVCVYPSHMEAMPNAWLEGMAMGKAIVASETGPGAEVIERGVSGLLCNPHDPSSIAQSIISLLGDARLRKQLGDAARSRIVEHFSQDVLVQRNLAFYRRCLESVSAAAPIST